MLDFLLLARESVSVGWRSKFCVFLLLVFRSPVVPLSSRKIVLSVGGVNCTPMMDGNVTLLITSNFGHHLKEIFSRSSINFYPVFYQVLILYPFSSFYNGEVNGECFC